MKKGVIFRWAVLTAALALLFGLLPSSAAEDEIYFTAVNDTLKKLEDATMPFSYGDQYYLPYTIFDDSSLGVFYSYNKENYTLTFYNKSNTLIFNLLLDYATDQNQQYRQSVIGKNNTLYIPIQFVCDMFRLKFQFINAAIPILRVVSTSDLDGFAFRDKNYDKLLSEGKAYLNRNSQSPSPSQPSASPGIPGSTPSQTPTEQPVIPEVFLSFDVSSAESLHKLLDTLDEYGAKGAFFLTPAVIDTERDAVRRMIGRSHSVGILMGEDRLVREDGSIESLPEQLNRANALLDSYTCTKTRLCRFAVGYTQSNPEEAQQAIAEAGFRIWDWNMNIEKYTAATAWQTGLKVIEAIEEAEMLLDIRFSDDGTSASVLPIVLKNLDNNHAIIHQITPGKSR